MTRKQFVIPWIMSQMTWGGDFFAGPLKLFNAGYLWSASKEQLSKLFRGLGLAAQTGTWQKAWGGSEHVVHTQERCSIQTFSFDNVDMRVEWTFEQWTMRTMTVIKEIYSWQGGGLFQRESCAPLIQPQGAATSAPRSAPTVFTHPLLHNMLDPACVPLPVSAASPQAAPSQDAPPQDEPPQPAPPQAATLPLADTDPPPDATLLAPPGEGRGGRGRGRTRATT